MIYGLLIGTAYVCIGIVIGFLTAMYLCWRHERIKDDEIYKYRGGKG